MAKNILIATLYGQESIVRTYLENQPINKIILFKDLTENKIQNSSYKYIEDIIKNSKTKLKEVKIPLYNMEEIIKTLKKIFKKNKKNNIYVDITHSRRVQALSIIHFLSILYPKNLKKVIYYSKDDNKLIEIPIYKVKELTNTELKIIKYIEKNQIFFQRDLAKHVQISIAQVSRLLDGLEKNNFIKKEKGKRFLTKKSKIYLNAIK